MTSSVHSEYTTSMKLSSARLTTTNNVRDSASTMGTPSPTTAPDTLRKRRQVELGTLPSRQSTARLFREKPRVNASAEEQYPPLFAACVRGDLSAVQTLLANAADETARRELVNTRATGDESTPLHHACIGGLPVAQQQQQQRQQLVKALLDAGAAVSAYDRFGLTPLHQAAAAGHADIAKLLVGLNAPLGVTHAGDCASPLHLAVFHAQLETARVLLDAGAQTDLEDVQGQVPLHKAAFVGALECARLLVERNPQLISHADYNGATPLHLAAYAGRDDVTALLLEHGANANAQDVVSASTPLHLAASNGHRGVALHLLTKGAVVDMINADGDAPLVWARQQGFNDVVRLLLDEGAEISVRYASGPAQSPFDSDYCNLDVVQRDAYGYVISKDYVAPTSKDVKHAAKQLALFDKKIMPRWEKYSNNPKKLSKAIYGGIPHEHRGEVWLRLTEARVVRKRMTSEYNDSLVAGSRFIKQIDLDIIRNWRKHIKFVQRYGEGERQLYNVLRAYSVYNKGVGYCQGMSGIMSMVLIYVPDEEDAFWLLDVLCRNKRYAMGPLFEPGFPKVFESFAVHDHLLGFYLPAVYVHLKMLGVQTVMYATRWYMTVLLGVIPHALVLRVWDAVLFDGYSAVFAFTLAIFRVLRRTLLRSNFDAVVMLLQDLTKYPFDIEDVCRKARKTHNKLRHILPELLQRANTVATLRREVASSRANLNSRVLRAQLSKSLVMDDAAPSLLGNLPSFSIVHFSAVQRHKVQPPPTYLATHPTAAPYHQTLVSSAPSPLLLYQLQELHVASATESAAAAAASPAARSAPAACSPPSPVEHDVTHARETENERCACLKRPLSHEPSVPPAFSVSPCATAQQALSLSSQPPTFIACAAAASLPLPASASASSSASSSTTFSLHAATDFATGVSPGTCESPDRCSKQRRGAREHCDIGAACSFLTGSASEENQEMQTD